MEVLDSQVVGGLIGLGLVVKGIAEWLLRRGAKGNISPTVCALSKEFMEEHCDKNYNELMLKLTEILAILRERK